MTRFSIWQNLILKSGEKEIRNSLSSGERSAIQLKDKENMKKEIIKGDKVRITRQEKEKWDKEQKRLNKLLDKYARYFEWTLDGIPPEEAKKHFKL